MPRLVDLLGIGKQNAINVNDGLELVDHARRGANDQALGPTILYDGFVMRLKICSA